MYSQFTLKKNKKQNSLDLFYNVFSSFHFKLIIFLALK